MIQTNKKCLVVFNGENPMSFVNTKEESVFTEITDEQNNNIDTLKTFMLNYFKAIKSLLEGKYLHLKDIVPEYLSNPGEVLLALCHDGIVIRYEKKRVAEKRIRIAIMPNGIMQVAQLFSQNVIKINSESSSEDLKTDLGIDMRIISFDSSGKNKQELAVGRIWFEVPFFIPEELPLPLQKPYCLLSVRNSLEVEFRGKLLPVESSKRSIQEFITKSEIALPVGWECIEVYPSASIDAWKPELAALWAENDLLANSFIAFQRQEFNRSLDSRAETRRQFASLLAAFNDLLESEPDREQSLQAFLQANPTLLYPSHVNMWPKLPLGSRETDFVFRDAANDYVLVELERSTLPLFRQDGHPSAKLTHAHGQIVDWKRYLEDNLQTVQRELGLDGITTNPAGLIVIGRSRDLTPMNRRKLQTMMNESPKLKIMTYDDVYENAKAVIENFLGPIWDVGGSTHIYYPRKS